MSAKNKESLEANFILLYFSSFDKTVSEIVTVRLFLPLKFSGKSIII